MLRDPASQPILDPDQLAGKTFGTSFRGFDQDEVRVYLLAMSEQLRELRTSYFDLQRRLEATQARVLDQPDLDEAQLTRLLGEETARVLSSAREAAADIRSKAEENVARLVREAGERADETRQAADQYSAEVRGDADREVEARVFEVEARNADIRAEAEAYSDKARTAADLTVERLTAEAEREATSVVNAAKALAERITSGAADAADRRRADAEAHADSVRSDADLYSEQVRSSADDAAARTRADADAVLERRSAEAEESADAIRRAARAEADELGADADRVRAEADTEAEVARESGRREGREMVAEARRVRERVLQDLARRRKLARQQLEQLRAARERLLESYEVVRRTVDEATQELMVALPEARVAAEDAGRRVATEPETSVDQLEVEIEAARQAGLPLVAPDLDADADLDADLGVDADGEITVGDTDEPEVDQPDAEDVAVADEEAGLDLAGPLLEGEGEADDLDATDHDEAVIDRVPDDDRHEVDEVGADEVSSATASEPAADRLDGDEVDAVDAVDAVEIASDDSGADAEIEPVRDDGAVDPDQVEVEVEVPPADVVGSDGAGPDVIGPVGTDVDPDQVEAVDLVGAEPPGIDEAAIDLSDHASEEAPEPAMVDVSGTEPVARKRDVDALFARLRASREKSKASARAVLTKAPAVGTGGGVDLREAPMDDDAGRSDDGIMPDEGTGSEAVSDDAAEPAAEAHEAAGPEPEALEQLLERRDGATEAVERSLARKLKRVLSDEQSHVLDAVRRTKGLPRFDEVFPTVDEHAGRFATASIDALRLAAQAGATFDIGPGDSSGDDERGDGAAVATEVDDVADGLGREFSSLVRPRIERCWEDLDGDEDELNDRIRAVYREWKTPRLASTSRHFILLAFSRGLYGAVPAGTCLRWVVDNGGQPCPDAEDNSLAGDVERGEPFPTGHIHPPAHPGCRCLAVPASRLIAHHR